MVMQEAFSYIVFVCTLLAVGIHVAGVNAAPESSTIDEALAHTAYAEVTGKEPDERRDAAFRFPGSDWSQQDDFHAKEKDSVRDFAKAHGVTVSSVVNSLDRGMREGWATHPNVTVSQRVVPCRPRLAY
jgi:hypothetical protein